jgi:aminoglycoside phosphotransferase (APT) family kinase protein
MIVDTVEQAVEVGGEALLVVQPIEATLDAAGLGEGPVSAERIGEGHSNITFLLSRGSDRFVLRRPPRPPLPPSAHDVLREARMLRSLTEQGARVPRVLLEHPDPSLLGVPFFVMEFVDGLVLTDELPGPLDTGDERRRIGEELIDALVELHSFAPPAAVKRGGYLERQLKRFSALWDHSSTRQIDALDEVTRRLRSSLPVSTETTFVHGDYRLGNTIFDRGAPARLCAILDWEMGTVGDPLADVGYLLATWVEPGYSPGPLALSPLTAQPGFLRRTELAERYEQLSGRRTSDLAWFQALALWKAAIFLEGNYRRWREGKSDDVYYEAMDVGVPALAELALQALDGR